MKMIAKILTIWLFFHNPVLTLANPNCCEGQNVITSNKTCVEGKVKKLACDTMFMIYANYSEIHIDGKNNLLFLGTEDSFPPDQFCLAKFEKKDTEIIIICAEVLEEGAADVRTINIILSFISVAFIILTIWIYIAVPQLLDTQGICLIHSITGLGFSFIILGSINLSTSLPNHHCKLLAYLMYLAFLYAFFWLNILCFHIWRVIVNPKILQFTKKWKLIYHIVGISGPILLLMFVLIANYSGHEFFHDIHPGIGEGRCWFKDPGTTFIYFYGPIATLLCTNVIYFIWTIIVLCRQMNQCSDKKAKILKYRLLLCIKLFFVMGISWCFEFVSAIFESTTSRWIWVLPDAINALQGFLIFLILVAFRKRVLRALANKRIFRSVRLPASWKTAQDDECEELEEELSLSTVEEKKPDILA